MTRQTKKRDRQCYRCDQAGITDEHVPPKSFFPEGHRKGLITVPSCEAHNKDNSFDVEYVRNIIVQPYHKFIPFLPRLKTGGLLV